MNITKLIIPAAGLGTRFLPITKTLPKEMLPLGNKPAIQHIVEEGIKSHIKEFYIIINKEKRELRTYFDTDKELEAILKQQGKLSLLDSIKEIQEHAKLFYIEQPKPLGLGHAIMMAQQEIGNNYFGVILPDDIIVCNNPGIGQLMHIAYKEHASVIAVQEVPQNKISSYGVIAIKEQITQDLFEIDHMVEKPSVEQAPSNLAIIGRYILSPKIFPSLEKLYHNHRDGELQLTHAIDMMMKNQQEKVYAYKIKGTRHDIGTPQGWMETIIDIAKREKK